MHRTRSTLKVALLCASVGLLASGTAAAERVVSAEDPDTIREIAAGFGSASIDKDSYGDPMIIGRINGTRYKAIFHGCDEGKRCDDIVLWAGWSGSKAGLDEVNEWNRTKRYGRAYIDNEGDPILEMAINLDYGVTYRNLEDSFNWWTKILSSFQDEVVN